MSTTKQVIVMRTDLGMRKGKMIAQGAHASIAWLSTMFNPDNAFVERGHGEVVFNNDYTPAQEDWLRNSFTKVCVRVDSEEELIEVSIAAREAGLNVDVIVDNGTTEFHGIPTLTCLAIGPDYAENIDPIAGHLKLL